MNRRLPSLARLRHVDCDEQCPSSGVKRSAPGRPADEGVANRIDPESCADAREGIGEALTGERIGQPLSRESTLIPGADVVRTRRPCLAGLNREPLSRIGRLRIGYGIDPDKIISPGSNGPSFSRR